MNLLNYLTWEHFVAFLVICVVLLTIFTAIKGILSIKDIPNELFPESIYLNLEAQDFKDANFGDTNNCPIAKALKRIFGKATIIELYDEVYIILPDKSVATYTHDFYNELLYQKDKSKISKFTDDYFIIRTILLTKDKSTINDCYGTNEILSTFEKSTTYEQTEED